MIDVNKKMREALMAVLDGAIIYDGTLVPAYSEENPNEAERLYIILNTQTEEDASPKTCFTTVGTILVDIVHDTDGYTNDVVDTVAGEVMQLLQPTPQTHGLTSPAGLQIQDLRRLSGNYQQLFSSEGNVMRRILRYEYRVNE